METFLLQFDRERTRGGGNKKIVAIEGIGWASGPCDSCKGVTVETYIRGFNRKEKPYVGEKPENGVWICGHMLGQSTTVKMVVKDSITGVIDTLKYIYNGTK